MTTNEHNKLIKKVAKRYFEIESIYQKGNSRTWIKDYDWWIIVIDLAPHLSEKGTFLNVSVCWLWNKNDFISYDFSISNSARIGEFLKFNDPDVFEENLNLMCQSAIECVKKLESMFSNYTKIYEILLLNKKNDYWSQYHLAVLSILLNHFDNFFDYKNEIESLPCDYAWQQKIKSDIIEIEKQIKTGNVLKYIELVIKEKRKMIKIQERNFNLTTAST